MRPVPAPSAVRHLCTTTTIYAETLRDALVVIADAIAEALVNAHPTERSSTS